VQGTRLPSVEAMEGGGDVLFCGAFVLEVCPLTASPSPVPEVCPEPLADWEAAIILILEGWEGGLPAVGPAEEAVAPSSSPVPGPEPLAGWVPASPFCAVSPSPPQADWEEGGSSVLILLQRRQSSSLDCRLPISAPDLPALGARLEVSVHGERLIGPESLAGWGPPLCAVCCSGGCGGRRRCPLILCCLCP
jgi:hypothetical protein